MSQQEEGWPLGLQPLNVRVGLVRNRDFNESLSFNTMLTSSPTSSTDSSSDLDTQSTASFFHDKSITLGSLIGISSILELSRRSTRGRTMEPLRVSQKNYKSKPAWIFSLCSKLSTDAVNMNETNNNNNNNNSSLGHFLEAERRAAAASSYGPDDFSHVLPVSETCNSLFVGDHVAPPPLSCSDNGEESSNRELFGYGALLLSCLCGQLTH